MSQEINVVLLVLLLMVFNCRLVVLKCLGVVLQSVVGLTEAILNAPVVVEVTRMIAFVLLVALKILGLFEIENGRLMIFLSMLTQAKTEVSL